MTFSQYLLNGTSGLFLVISFFHTTHFRYNYSIKETVEPIFSHLISKKNLGRIMVDKSTGLWWTVLHRFCVVCCKQCDQKKLPNIYKSCPEMISLEKLKILTPLQKFPKNMGDLGKLIIAKGIKNLTEFQ